MIYLCIVICFAISFFKFVIHTYLDFEEVNFVKQDAIVQIQRSWLQLFMFSVSYLKVNICFSLMHTQANVRAKVC